MLEKFSPMSLIVRYRNPRRPDEAGMLVVPDPKEVAETKDRLERRGFLVIEIAAAPFAKTPDQSD